MPAPPHLSRLPSPMLRLGIYRFHLQARTPVHLGGFPGSVLRSALGGALRALSCETGAPTCEGCPLRTCCPYGALYEPAARPSDGLHSGFADAPRPYVVHLPRSLPPTVPAHETFCFELVLVEGAAALLPHLVRALERLERTGLGARRDRGAGLFRLVRVAERQGGGECVLWRRGEAPPVAPPPTAAWPRVRLDSGTPLQLRFVTPLRLRADGRPVEAPTLHDVAAALARRVRALAAVHASPSASLPDLDEAVEAAAAVGAQTGRFRPYALRRYSRRQRRRHAMKGVVGTCTAEPGWEAAAPLLQLGRWLHVGKSATMGLGHYHLATPSA